MMNRYVTLLIIALIIYADSKNDDKTSKDVFVSWSVKELLDRRGSMYDAHIMCMKENEMDNFLDSVSLAETNVPIICLANFTPAHHPMNINFFSLTDCSARVFWQQFPVEKPDETIMIIGFGNAGTVMLDCALELNIFSEDQHLTYHVLLFRFQSGYDVPMWEKLGSLTKDMNYVTVDHISCKVRMALGEEAPSEPFDELPAEILRKAAAVFTQAAPAEKERFRRLEHERILRCYLLHNYRYHETQDDELRYSPLIRSYEELSESEKALTDIGWTLLDELAAHKEARGKR